MVRFMYLIAKYGHIQKKVHAKSMTHTDFLFFQLLLNSLLHVTVLAALLIEERVFSPLYILTSFIIDEVPIRA